MSTILRATGRSVAILRFDPAALSALREVQREHLAYHFKRLIVGEGSALSEWKHLGISIEVQTETDRGEEV